MFAYSYFKTSYVEVYHGKDRKMSESISAFQNILCWSLSCQQRTGWRQSIYFKTSYVEVYPDLCGQAVANTSISKHLMLKFIILFFKPAHFPSSFQNILCWSLSWSRLRYRKWKTYFKTSYVEVYPNNYRRLHGGHAYFKTSYVEVYPLRRLKITPIQLNFKTSYVEVYLNPLYNLITRNVISKHLMLKFIHPIS